MAKYTVVIKNRFLDEQTVARVKTFDDEKEFYTLKLAEWYTNCRRFLNFISFREATCKSGFFVV